MIAVLYSASHRSGPGLLPGVVCSRSHSTTAEALQMALRATVFRAELDVSDLERSHYATYTLTIARHPSETDERMIVRMLAFALNADPSLEFGAGLSATDEPALWRRDLTGRVLEWIEVGQPDPRVIRKASARSDVVKVYAYGRGADVWWSKQRDALARFEALQVFGVIVEPGALESLAERNMKLHVVVQEGIATLGNASQSVTVNLERLR